MAHGSLLVREAANEPLRSRVPPDKDNSLNRESLKRITSGGEYLPEVDGLRFVAIVSVILYHVFVQSQLFWIWQGVPGILEHFRRGVELFFVISGFILALPFARQHLQGARPVRLKQYFYRRLTRLEPPYILIVCFRAVLWMAATRLVGRILVHLFWTLLYLHNVRYGLPSSIHIVAWTLEVEVQFYILAPVFAMGYRMRGRWLRRGLLMLVMLGAGLYQVSHFTLYSRPGLSLLNWGQYFLAGMLLADFYLCDLPALPSSYLWDGISLAAWMGIFLLPTQAAHYLMPFLCVAAYVAAFKGKLFPKFLRIEWVSIIGGMCYSLYLTHPMVLSVYEAAFRHLHWAILANRAVLVALIYACTVPTVLVVGAFYFVLVERPCMRKDWPQRLALWFRQRLGQKMTEAG